MIMAVHYLYLKEKENENKKVEKMKKKKREKCFCLGGNLKFISLFPALCVGLWVCVCGSLCLSISRLPLCASSLSCLGIRYFP